LSAVDVVRHAVESSDNDLSGEANNDSLQVVTLVDGTCTKLVVVQSAHSPAQRGLLLPELGVVLFASLSKQQTVSLARVLVFLDGRGPLLGRAVDIHGRHLLSIAVEHGGLGLAGRALDIAGVLHNGVVGNLSEFSILRGGLAEKHRALDDIPDSEVVVLLDDLSMDEGDEEQGGEEEQTKSDTKGDTGDVPGRLVGETESWRSLVDNGEGTDSASNKEEEGRGPDSPAHGVLADVYDILHKREDDRAEDARRDGCHTQASENGSKSRSLVPSPLHVASTNCSNTNTGDGRDEGVGRRNVGRVAGTPHDPDSGTSRRASECEKLNGSVAVECRDGDNAVLDGRCSSGTDCEGTGDFEDQTEDHGLLVCDRAGGNTRGPSVCNIVCEG
jgi:hypothetical protein